MGKTHYKLGLSKHFYKNYTYDFPEYVKVECINLSSILSGKAGYIILLDQSTYKKDWCGTFPFLKCEGGAMVQYRRNNEGTILLVHVSGKEIYLNKLLCLKKHVKWMKRDDWERGANKWFCQIILHANLLKSTAWIHFTVMATKTRITIIYGERSFTGIPIVLNYLFEKLIFLFKIIP